MTIHAYLDHPLKLTHKDPCVSLAAKPIPWPDVPCLSLPYAQPTNECSLCTHLPQEYTHRPWHTPHPPYTLSLYVVPAAHFLTFPYAPHMPLVLSPAPGGLLPTRILHTSLHTSCMLSLPTPCTPLELTLPFCSSDAPRHLHTPPACSCTHLPTSYLQPMRLVLPSLLTTRPLMPPSQQTPGSCTPGLTSYTEPLPHARGPLELTPLSPLHTYACLTCTDPMNCRPLPH